MRGWDTRSFCSDEYSASAYTLTSSRVVIYLSAFFFFFSSRRRHTRFDCDWSSDVCSSDLTGDCAPDANTLCFARGTVRASMRVIGSDGLAVAVAAVQTSGTTGYFAEIGRAHV